jgi:tRNA threonylcarbamoyladenosine modification (KEOPS) complex  Pcc1 subunit
MHETILRLECKNPKAVKDSLEPDIENSDDATTQMSMGEGFVEIKVKARKLGRLKALMNTYFSLVGMLSEAHEELFEGKV